MNHRSKRWVSGPAEILLLLSIVACVLEGTLRKWVFRESAGPIKYTCYFAKDFIFAAILLCRSRGALNKSLRTVLIVSLPLILTGAALAAVHDLARHLDLLLAPVAALDRDLLLFGHRLADRRLDDLLLIASQAREAGGEGGSDPELHHTATFC